MSFIDGFCHCDIYMNFTSETDMFTEIALLNNENKALRCKCIEDFRAITGESEVLSFEEVEDFTINNGTRLECKLKDNTILDDLLAEAV